jgi:hypothetical protein
MSNETAKSVRGRRIQQKNRHITRQVRIRQAHKFPNPTKDGRIEKPHRYHKTSGVTCGNSRCAMCGNPRKFFADRTTQEKRQMQDVDNPRTRYGLRETDE